MLTYDIYLRETVVGCAAVSLVGMYCDYKCTCKLPDNQIYKIFASNGKTQVCLGICVPEGTQYTAVKQLPYRILGMEKLQFHVVPNHVKPIAAINLNPEKHFQAIEDLPYLRFCRQNNYPVVYASKSKP